MSTPFYSQKARKEKKDSSLSVFFRAFCGDNASVSGDSTPLPQQKDTPHTPYSRPGLTGRRRIAFTCLRGTCTVGIRGPFLGLMRKRLVSD
uniref:Uncharacterized protein n=1 Tax=Candidatus Kentrum sp. FM TaxID=2126340 RepID=A0A450SIG5_9GAMM|nr:MAG: hypothetical protein BECKFM1743C_GA0114222_1011912 [Candidatus Kentron sp. FM]